MAEARGLGGLAATALAASLALAAALLMGYLMVLIGQVKAQRTDLAELRDVRYGLLDPDAWVERVSAILGRKIESFELTESNRLELRADVALVLDRLIVEIDEHLRQRNQTGPLHKRVGGALRQMVQDALVDVDELRERVPAYADAILDELGKPEPKRRVREQIAAMLGGMAGATFAHTDRSARDLILKRHACAGVADCQAHLAAASAASHRRAMGLTLAELVLVASLYGLCLWRSRRLTLTRMAVMTFAGMVLLVGGVATPMIEIDARIGELSFQLLGEPVVFRDQVLYFQSKSLFDVVAILLDSGTWDMALVAALVVLFSLWFPLLKVAAGLVYLADWRGLRRSPLVRFFALQAGKWSMADVLVIAIFMAYVGFRGLVASQLAEIAGVGTGAGSGVGKAVEVLTTNGTALQPGFYLFLGFVLAGLMLSHLLAATVVEEGGPRGAVT